MRPSHLRELRDKHLISEVQFAHLNDILSAKVVSVFYELRTLLYLGILLFTAGAGLLIYENIGEIGHVLSISVLFILTAICFHYSVKHALPYSNGRTTHILPYYDYLVLFSCLLFISVLGYLQFQYEWFTEGMEITTLITAIFFLFCAYRFDHIGVLSLAITALASFWSLSISPQKWYEGDFLDEANLHNTAIIFATTVALAAMILHKKKIKQHFTFTYLHFCSLLFLVGALSGMFMREQAYGLYLLLLYAGCAVLTMYAHKNKSFLFLLYSFVAAYIGTTYMLIDVIGDSADIFLWFLYLLCSCGGFIYFIIRYKSYFKRSA
jgi:hypothetical protein